MNFAYGVIAIVGVLAAIILGFIAVAPDDIIQPRMIPVEEMVVVSEPTTIVEPEPEAETSPMTLTVSIPEGVGVPGCEETNGCYFPYELSVAVGTTVTWINDDIAAHTVTSGNFPEHDGLFDSSIFLSGETFEITFNDAGTFDYYCFVHPWMAGIVNVS